MHASGSDDQEKELSRLKKEQSKLKEEIKLLEKILREASTLTDMTKASKELRKWVAVHYEFNPLLCEYRQKFKTFAAKQAW